MPQRVALLAPLRSSRWRGLLATTASAFVFMGLARVVPGVPDHTVLLLLLPVGFAAMDGGLLPGLASSFVLLLVASWFFATIKPPDASPDPVLQLLTIGVAAPALALLVTARARALLRRERAARTTAELSLSESQVTLRTLYDSAPMLMGLEEIVGSDILHLSGNERTARYFGGTIEKVNYRLASELGVAPQHIAEWITHYRECERSGSPVRFESSRDGPDGPRWYAMTVAPAGPGPEGRPRFVYLMEDVTERRRTEAALRDAEERYRQFIALASEGVWRDEFDAPIPVNLPEEEQVSLILHTAYLAECNDACARMYGYGSAAEMVGARYERFFNLDDPAIVALFRRMVRARYTVVDEETRERDVHGNERWFVNNIVGIVEDGRLMRLWSTQRDITEAKLAAAQLQSSQEQLRQAQKMEAVGQLTGGIAHDLNNRLTVVSAHGELLLSSLPPGRDDLRSDTEALLQAARSGADLIRRLLAFSRRSALELKATDLTAVIESLAGTLRRLLPASISVKVVQSGSEETVLADAGAVEQIVLNVATNARDAMPEGGVFRLEVQRAILDDESCRTRGWGTPGEYVRVLMSDTGIGMDAATRARVFEPFFTTKPPHIGTGLGLAITYGLVKAHQGFIDAQSEPGAGTTITIYLPRHRAGVPDGTAVPASAPRGGTETILIAEDEGGIRRSAKRILERYGYTVLTAEDGVAALELVRKEPDRFQLVISDVVMPRMGGRELHQTLRREAPALRIFFTSGYTAQDIRETSDLDSQVPFLHKPWTVADLLARVREVLDAPTAG